MKIQRRVLIALLPCLLLIASVFGAAFIQGDSGSVARAIGPMQSPLPTPQPTSPPSTGGCTAVTTANIRSGPSTRYRVIGRLPRGVSFTVTKRSGSWRYGTSRFGRGWVLASLLRCR